MYKVCKKYEVESGHMLSKHKGTCRFPHGHSRVIEVIVKSDNLDDNDMVVDFKELKGLIEQTCSKYDHSMMINKSDKMHNAFYNAYNKQIISTPCDPTTEVMAKMIYCDIKAHLSDGVELERIRVSETSSSWAEYSEGVLGL